MCRALSVLSWREPQVINNAWKGRDTFTSVSNASVAQCCVCIVGYVIRLPRDLCNLQVIGEIIQGPRLLIVQPHLLSQEDMCRLWSIGSDLLQTHMQINIVGSFVPHRQRIDLNFTFSQTFPRFIQSESLDRNSPTCGYNLRGKSS